MADPTLDELVESFRGSVDPELVDRAAALLPEVLGKPNWTCEQIEQYAREWAEHEAGLTDSGEPRRKG